MKNKPRKEIKNKQDIENANFFHSSCEKETDHHSVVLTNLSNVSSLGIFSHSHPEKIIRSAVNRKINKKGRLMSAY